MTNKPKPILREYAYLELMSAMTKLIGNGQPFQNCHNCMSWMYDEDKCRRFNAKPPTHILINSCEAYEDDGIVPF